MHGPAEGSGMGEISEDVLIFDAKNRADKISIILFGDYGNAALPLTLPLLIGSKIDAVDSLQIMRFLEFYGTGGPNSWILAEVGGDLQAEDIESHPYEHLISELDTLVRVANDHLQGSRLREASRVASKIIQFIRSQTPHYSIKHN